MAEATPMFSGVLSLREPISLPKGRFSSIYCDHWTFKIEEGLEIAERQPQGPSMRSLFAVAVSKPVSDPDRPGMARTRMLAMIPVTNVLGFAACDKAPPKSARLDSEAAPA